MNSELKLLTTKEFNGIQLNCYQADDSDDFWVTREQIGKLLEYSKPMRSIANLHERNADRLNKFSTIIKLMTVEGNRTVTRDMTVYNLRGIINS